MTRRKITKFLSILALMLPGGLSLTATTAAAVELIPHSAQYELHLLETRVGDIGAVSGTMDLSLKRSCRAWISSSHLNMNGGDPENPSIEVDAVSRQSEALDGSWLDFVSKVEVDGAPAEAVEGRAEVDEEGRGTAQFTTPRDVAFPIPKGTYFPIAAARYTLDQIWNQDKKLVNYLMFDGDSPTPVRGTDIVAGTPGSISSGLRGDTSLVEGPRRRVITTLFDLAETDSEPQATYIVDILENGIATRITVDMGFMVVEAILSHVDAIPLPDCD